MVMLKTSIVSTTAVIKIGDFERGQKRRRRYIHRASVSPPTPHSLCLSPGDPVSQKKVDSRRSKLMTISSAHKGTRIQALGILLTVGGALPS